MALHLRPGSVQARTAGARRDAISVVRTMPRAPGCPRPSGVCAHPSVAHHLRRVHVRPRMSYFAVQSVGSTTSSSSDAKIKVLGVGGGGGNALNRMIESGLKGVEFWAVNTDAQALAHHPSPNKLQIGLEITRGLGCGGNPDLGRQAAEESKEAIKRMVDGSDLVFVAAGMGGGTGTGAAPVVAKASKDQGILTIAVVTSPFSFEGRRRRRQALDGVMSLRQCVDSVILIPNDKLLDVSSVNTTLTYAFGLADDVLRQGVQGISDIVTRPGLINVDFADIRAVMQNAGTAMLGMGRAGGPDRAEKAAMDAVSGPLVQQSIQNATGIVVNITGGDDLGLAEVNLIGEMVQDLTDDANANIIWGTAVNNNLGGDLCVTLIATGFSSNYEETLLGADSAGNTRTSRRYNAAQAASSSPAAAPAAAPQPQQQRLPQQQGGAPEGGLPWRVSRNYTGRPLL